MNANVIALNDDRFIVDARRPLKPKHAVSAPAVPPSAPSNIASKSTDVTTGDAPT